jgi:hypothetical protein
MCTCILQGTIRATTIVITIVEITTTLTIMATRREANPEEGQGEVGHINRDNYLKG